MHEGVKGKCKYALAMSFDSMDNLIKFMEEVDQKKDEFGIARVKWIEERALDKAVHLVKRKDEKQREKSILLGSEKAFLSIMEKFSSNEKGVFLEGGVK